MYWQELTEQQKREAYKRYVNEVNIKHTETYPMNYEQFCHEWDDCYTVEVNDDLTQ